MGFFLVVKAELVRTFIIMRRYWFRTVTGILISYGFMIVLILGLLSGGADMAEKLADAERATSWALGLILGMFAFGIVGMFSQGLQLMAQNGQLEQLCMSPHGLVTNFLARTFVGSITSVLTSAVLVWLVARTFGGTLHFDPVATLLVLALTFCNLLGFGFLVGGLVLVFKQVGQVVVIVRMALVGLALVAERVVASPAGWIAHGLPVTDAAICLKYVLIHGQCLEDGTPMPLFAHESFYFLIANGIVWTLLGIVSFRVMENWSRSKGTLGAY